MGFGAPAGERLAPGGKKAAPLVKASVAIVKCQFSPLNVVSNIALLNNKCIGIELIKRRSQPISFKRDTWRKFLIDDTPISTERSHM